MQEITDSIPGPGRSHMLRATNPLHHSYWACALEPENHNYWSPSPRTCAQQQEKPPQWEAHAPQLESSPYLLQLEKSLNSNEEAAQPKINKKFLKTSVNGLYYNGFIIIIIIVNENLLSLA